MSKTNTSRPAAVAATVALSAAQIAALVAHVPAHELDDCEPAYGLITAVRIVAGGAVKVTREDADGSCWYYRGRQISHRRGGGTDPRTGAVSGVRWHVGHSGTGQETLADMLAEIDARISAKAAQ